MANSLNKIDDRGLNTPIDLLDNEKIRFGNSDDLEIYHNGSHSYITDTGTGNLYIHSNYLIVSNAGGTEDIIKAASDGAVELYHNNIKTFETVATGIKVYGTEGGHGEIYLFADEGDDYADNWLVQAGTDGAFYIKNSTSGSWEVNLKTTGNGNVELYYDNVKKAATYADGLAISGNASQAILRFNDTDGNTNYQIAGYDGNRMIIMDGTGGTVLDLREDGDNIFCYNTFKLAADNLKATWGAGDDLQIYHDGTNTHLNNGTGGLYIRNENIYLRGNATDEPLATFNANGGVELYYDNSKKFATYSSGVQHFADVWFDSDTTAGRDAFWDSSASLLRFYDQTKATFGGADDLQIFHDGSNSWIKHDGTGIIAIATADLQVCNVAGNEQMIRAYADGAVELYHNNSKKFSTESTGPHLHGLSAGSGHSDLRYKTSDGQLYYDSSTRLVKTDIVDSPYGIDTLKQLKPRRYKRTDIEGTPTEIGFIADEVVGVIPEIVPFGPKSFYTKNDSDTEDIPINVDYRRMTAVLTTALQEAITKIETLETEVAALKAE